MPVRKWACFQYIINKEKGASFPPIISYRNPHEDMIQFK